MQETVMFSNISCFYFRVTVRANCPMDLRLFPFDKQQCDLNIESCKCSKYCYFHPEQIFNHRRIACKECCLTEFPKPADAKSNFFASHSTHKQHHFALVIIFLAGITTGCARSSTYKALLLSN